MSRAQNFIFRSVRGAKNMRYFKSPNFWFRYKSSTPNSEIEQTDKTIDVTLVSIARGSSPAIVVSSWKRQFWAFPSASITKFEYERACCAPPASGIKPGNAAQRCRLLKGSSTCFRIPSATDVSRSISRMLFAETVTDTGESISNALDGSFRTIGSCGDATGRP